MPRGRPLEPTDDRLTEYGSTSFDGSASGSLSTAPVPWDRTEHVAFEMPRPPRDRVRSEQVPHRTAERMVTLALVLVSLAVAAVVFALAR
ncbi:MAG TPA: hypothetical protein VLE94_05755 [Burkholderiaceae bacterium]|nr:hypothetical protein [Burkholderiaceae bacterium]